MFQEDKHCEFRLNSPEKDPDAGNLLATRPWEGYLISCWMATKHSSHGKRLRHGAGSGFAPDFSWVGAFYQYLSWLWHSPVPSLPFGHRGLADRDVLNIPVLICEALRRGRYQGPAWRTCLVCALLLRIVKRGKSYRVSCSACKTWQWNLRICWQKCFLKWGTMPATLKN